MRMARRKSNGEHFLEVPPEHWDLFLGRNQADGSHPAPMPVGHRMFNFPQEYGVDVFEVDDVLLLAAAMEAPQ